MPINLRLSSSASGTRNTGPINMGGGVNLVQRSLFSTSTPSLDYSQWYVPGAGSPAISTSDYYLMNGILGTCYDLDTMGSEGATVKSREGMRYVWVLSADHPNSVNFQGSGDFYVGYSNDPQVWPSPTTIRMLRREKDSVNLVDQNGTTQNTYYAYHAPFLVYNPDSAGDKFYIYAEGRSDSSGLEHELTLFTSADFLTTTMVGPTIPVTTVSGWTSFGRPVRTGVNTWVVYSFGKISGASVTPTWYKYTSTDGWVWTADYSTVLAGPGPFTTISGQDYLLTREVRTDNDYVSLLAVNASKVSSGTYTRVSSAFGPSSGSNNVYPGPTYLQGVEGYEEDGVLSIYASRGFFPATTLYSLANGPYRGYFPTFFDAVGSASGTTLTISSNPTGYAILPGFMILNNGRTIVSDDGGGNYTLDGTASLAGGTTINFARNGGLWQNFIDQYSIITNPTAAANAAPMGVTADCVSGTVTVSWNNVLPNNTYRVYRGTTAGTQATLVGNVTGNSITDTPTVGSQYFYKVVTMNSGVEQKSRVVNVYCSNNTLMVTRHVNRVVNDGGDTSKIDMTFLASVDSFLTSNDYYKYLMYWVDARFGVKLDGSGFVSKVYCLGTTRLPRGGDYTPTTSNTFPSTSSNTSYSATSFRGTTPSWVNNASSAHGFFGNGRPAVIQRKTEITLIAAYQRPSGTGVATLFGQGKNSGGMFLQQAAGSSGNISFSMYASNSDPSSGPITATVAFASATTAKVVAGVFDGTNITAYLDGVAGTPVSASSYANPNLTSDTVLRGDHGSFNSVSTVLVSGSRSGTQTRITRAYTLDNEALFTGACLAVFEKGAASIVSGVGAFYT